MESIALIAIIVVIAILGIFLAYYFAKLRFEIRFRQWQEMERQKWEAEIEKAIGMEMGKSGVTVRDHVVAAGVEFSQAKAKLQALLDAN